MKNKFGVFLLSILTLIVFSDVPVWADGLQLSDIISGPGSASATGGGTTTTVTTNEAGQTTTTKVPSTPDPFGDSVTSDNVIDRNGKIIGHEMLRSAIGPGGFTDLEMAAALLFGDFYVEGPFWVEWFPDAPPVSSRDIQSTTGDIKPLSEREQQD